MSTTDAPLPPPQNLALIKAVTAFLGLLLVGGVVLLGVLLTRGGADEAERPAAGAPRPEAARVVLAEGERVTRVGPSGSGVVLTIEGAGEGTRLVLVPEAGPAREVRIVPAP